MRIGKIIIGAIVLVTITAWLTGMATLGMQRSEANVQIIEREGPINDGPNPLGQGQAEQGSTDSKVDLYKAWLADNDVQAEEDMADDLALATCGAFDAGNTVSAILSVPQDNGYTLEQAAAMVMGAVRIYCPEHEPTIDAFIGSATGVTT